jgi:gliding motility-associated-like protein
MKKVLRISGTLVFVLCLLGTYASGQKVSKATGTISALSTWTDLIPGTGSLTVLSGNTGGSNSTAGAVAVNDALFDNQNNFIGIVIALPTTTSFTLQNGALTSLPGVAFKKQGTSDVTVAPAAGDYLVIRNGHTITINQAFSSRNTIVNNGIIITTSPLTFNYGAAYIHYRNGGVIPAAIWDASSNCFIIGVTANSPEGSDQNFGNFVWNCPSQTANGDIAGLNEMIVNGNFNLVSTGTGLATLRNSITVNGNLIISAGTLDVSAANYQITLGGNWINGNGGDGFSERKGTVIFKGSANQRISKPTGMAGEVFYNLIINNPSGIKLDDNNIAAINTISMLDGNIDANGRTMALINPSTGALLHTNGQLFGGFIRRSVNTISGSYLFPVGTNNYYNSLLLGFNSMVPSGYLEVQFLEGDPLGGGLPLSEGGVNINNQYTDGYWSVTSSAGYASTYDLTLNAEGFASYTVDESTRILKRTDFGNWALSGTHSLQVPPLCKRTGISGIDATGSTTYFGLGKSDCITISSGPSDVNSCIGQNAGFSVSATGAGLAFRWQKNGVDLSDAGPYSNTGTEAMTISNVSDAEVGLYRCRITSTCSGSTVVYTKNALLDLSLPFPSLGYKYYRNITIDQSMVQGLSDLTNFPLLISGTYPFLRTMANGGQVQNANGYDIVFTDNRGFKLDHQIEKYDPATGEFIAWVRMPVLYTYQNSGLRMLYGNPQVTGNPSVNTVFNKDFRGVWHLNDQNIITDQTGGGSNGTNMGNGGAVNISGKIDGALNFVNGDGDFISIANEPHFDIQNAITVSAWIKVKSFTVAGQAIITKGNSAWSLQRDGTNNTIGFYLDPSAILNGTVNVNDGNWHYVVGTYDKQVQSLYIDGVLDNFTGNTNPINLNNYFVYIGNNPESTGSFFDGIIDEARVSDIARSGSWVKTEYANQSNPGNFYALGPESPNSIFSNFASCGNTSTIYSVPNTPGHIYTWSVSGGAFLPTSGNSIYVTWNETGPWNIQLSESSGGCSASSLNFIVTVNPLPVPVIAGDNDVCPGTAGEVYSTPLVPGNTYYWTFTGGTVPGSYIENSISVDWDATGPGTLKVTEYNTTTGCSITTPDFVVQIRDLSVPVIIAPSPVTVFTDAGVCTASGVALGNPVTSDNCTIASVINDAPAVFPLGTTTVTWTITDGVGNSATATQAVTVNLLPAPVLFSSDSDNTFCTGTSVTFNATGAGWTNFDFRVNGISVQNGLLKTYTTASLTNGQIVDVKVTNTGGCSATSAGITNIVNALPVVTFPGVLPSQCVGSAIYPLSGGNPAGGTYSGPGVIGSNFNAGIAGLGTHIITYSYTNVNGCTNTATNTIIVKALPSVSFTGLLVSQCVSSATYVLSGGTPAGGTYSGPGVTGTNFNASVAGAGVHTITYTYTDVISGCTNTATNTIVVKALPVVSFPGVLKTKCVNWPAYPLSGGTPAGGTYSGPGVVGINFNPGLAGPGTHTITYSYTDVISGCSNTATNTIVVNDLPVVTFPGVLLSQCANSTTYTLSGGLPAGGTYSGPGVTGNNFNASVAGVGTRTITYSYTSAEGCTNTATNTIVVKALPVVTFQGILASQCVSSVTYLLSGGTPAGGTYSGPGVTGTNFNASVAGAGLHTIIYTYTDLVSGCTNVAINTIIVRALPLVTFPGVLTSQCISSSVYALTGGTPAGGTYSGTGVSGTNFNASVAGTGTHTITYSYTDVTTGCANTATNSIIVNPLPAPTFTEQPGASACTNIDVTYTTQAGQSNYEWTFQGVLNYDYKLISGGTTTDNTVILKWLTAGSKTVTINYTDGNGCKAAAATASTSTAINESPSVSNAGTDQTGTLMCGITSTRLAANTPVIGTGSWSIISGTGGTIAAPDNPESIFSGTAGIQYVLRWTISNSTCTSSTDDVIVRFNQSPTVTDSHTDVLCFGESNGTINISATRGTAPYTYLWTGRGVAPLSEDQTGLSAGIYSVIVTDANGCSSASLSVTISEPSALSGNISSRINVSVFGGNDGSVTLAGTGGTPSYQYKSGSGAYQSSGTFGTLSAGSYTFTIRDMNLCTFNIEVTITQPVQPLSGSVVSKTDVACYGASTGSVTVVASGGVAPYEYKLGAGSYQSSGTFGSLAAGTYNVTIRDAVLGTFDLIVTISQPSEALSGIISSQTNVMCFGSNTGTFTVAGSGGTSPYKYKPGAGSYQDSGTFGSLTAGIYTITIQDVNLCTFTLDVTITQPQAVLTGSIATKTEVLCFGSAGGSVTALGLGGTSPYMYNLNGGAYQTSGTFNGLSATAHTITVRDANLCTANIQVTITQPPALSVTYIPEEASCRGNKDGRITLSVTGGVAPYIARWPDGVTTVDRVALTNGTYRVLVTDKNGCAVSIDVELGFKISDQCIEIPDIITPNNDTFNDTWQIKNIDLFPNAEVFVYNRWGMLVYNSENLSANPWDGTFKGKLLPTDSYHYVLHLNDGSEPRTGVVSIIR